LSLCKRFVELNHGEIDVVSKDGEGTTFKVTLPAEREHVDLCTDQHKSKAKLA
ncbi:MAG: sensor histidine kinase, partial [Pseudomonadota bacterium]|nr:sensor histidine kinase [Pseudomonadota bacterium]